MTRVLISGSGGQGVLFLGKLLAHGAMLGGKYVTWFPAYGAEMRGGTANCRVIISEELIGSPITRESDVLIVLNEASKERFEGRLKEGGLMIMDSFFIKTPPARKDISVLEVPAAEIALSLGNAKSANMVMFGALLSTKQILDESIALTALDEMTPERRRKSLGLNREAIRAGKAYLNDKKS